MRTLFRQWDIIFVAVPNQEDQNKFTKRPAIILAVNNDKTVSICPIIKQIHQARNYKYAYEITPNSPEALGTNLNQLPSLVVLDRIANIPLTIIEFVFGTCPQALIDKIQFIIKENKLLH